MNPFVKHVDEYVRNIDVRKGSIQQIAKYLSLNTRKTYEECRQYVVKEMQPGGRFPLRDPAMLQLIRKGPGHRVQDETTFLGYVGEIIDSGRIVSPSLTVYERPEVEKSVTAEWQDDNIAARKKSKKEMFRLKQIGELLKSALADYDQNARKIRINSVSGQRGFPGNPLFLATGHSSLTSLCRAAAGYGNGTVERFLAGSRHYHTPEIAKANILAVLTLEDYGGFDRIIKKYDLVYPTVEDTMKMIRRSTDLYWDTPEEIVKIQATVEGMSELERAIYTYSGDMYHLAILNPTVVRQLLGDMIAINIDDIADVEIVDTDTALTGLDSTEIAYVNALCANILKGSTHDLVKAENPEGWQVIGRTALKFKKSLEKYHDLINTVFTPRHLPPTVASLKSIQRRVCLAADTDSSIFTTEWWVEWYTGHLKRGEVEDRIWYLTTYMVCQCIAHSLAMLSANVGVEKKYLFRLAMKNEFAFPEFALTNLAKHYYSTMSMREGNVYEELELEVKGVELRGSTSTRHILDGTEKLMFDTLKAVNNGEKLLARDVLKLVAQSELDTIRSIMKGEYTYLKSAQIKPNSNKLLYHELWQDVFGPKYGTSVEPPYPCVKVSTELVNKTAVREWLENMEDRELAKRMAAWMDKWKRKDLKTLMLPTMAIRAEGLPIEVQDAANVRKLAYSINSGYYKILESMGLYLVDRNHQRMVFDILGMKP